MLVLQNFGRCLNLSHELNFLHSAGQDLLEFDFLAQPINKLLLLLSVTHLFGFENVFLCCTKCFFHSKKNHYLIISFQATAQLSVSLSIKAAGFASLPSSSSIFASISPYKEEKYNFTSTLSQLTTGLINWKSQSSAS